MKVKIPMISLGLICYQGHSSAAVLIRDGIVLGAVAEERFSRKKFDDAFPEKSIDYLTREFNLKFSDIDHVGIAWSPKNTVIGQLKKISFNSLRFAMEKRVGATKRSRLQKFLLISNLKGEIRKRYKYKGKISYVDHHLSHALSAYVQSGHGDGVVMVADGMGEHASTTLYEFKEGKHEIIYQDSFPHSLGVFYSAATQFLGFTPDSDEFKVMGMSAYSRSQRFHERVGKLYSFKKKHLFLNLNYFDIHKKGNQFFSRQFQTLFADIKTFEDKIDFAHSLQFHLNEIVLSILKELRSNYTSKHFSASGGVFLNCLLNQKIRESQLFDSYTFFPVADDNGTALGAAQAVAFHNPRFIMKKVDHLFLGPCIGQVDETLLSGLQYKKISDYKEVAKLLSEGNIVAWVHDKMEFGHRSLGNRSILGDPRIKTMKDTINQKVKLREAFRPFAPSILQEKLSECFEIDEKFGSRYPFMIETLNAKEKTKAMAPAIVHEDGTSRIQTVSKSDNPKYYQLINEFYSLTGCPIILNTSFNINGMPIVHSSKDAIECFLKTDIDYLVLKEYLVWK